MYVYIKKSEAGVYTVGFYAPDDEWHPESDWPTREEAAGRVIELNGGIKRPEENEENKEKLAVVVKCFEENIGIITPMVAEELKDIAEAYPTSWFVEAVRRACEQGKHRLVYVKAILENWRRDGKDKPARRPDTSGITVIEG